MQSCTARVAIGPPVLPRMAKPCQTLRRGMNRRVQRAMTDFGSAPQDDGRHAGPALGRDQVPHHRRHADRPARGLPAARAARRPPMSARTSTSATGASCSSRGPSPRCSTASTSSPATWCSTSGPATATRPRSPRAWPRPWWPSSPTPTMAREAEQALSAAGVDNAAVIEGPLAEGDARHGPYDVILIEGGVERVPETLVCAAARRRADRGAVPGGALGTCRLGYKADGQVSWRFAFNAGAPVLPGFERVATLRVLRGWGEAMRARRYLARGGSGRALRRAERPGRRRDAGGRDDRRLPDQRPDRAEPRAGARRRRGRGDRPSPRCARC